MEKNKKFVGSSGVTLNFSGNDTLSTIVKEVITEAAIKLEDIDEDLSGIKDTIQFLKTNFDLPEKTKE